MISLALLLALQVAATPGEARGTVVDAVTRAPVAAARVEGRRAAAWTDADGRFSIRADAGDTLRVRRIGYGPASVVVRGDSLAVALAPSAFRLGDVSVDARRDVARHAATVALSEPRGSALSTAEAVARLPFVSARSSRSGLALSMRGARPEQVIVLLDGVPLGDPATGTADVSDIPLIAVGSATVVPGADALRAGPGASGGVLALGAARGSSAAAHAGAFGRVGASAAHEVAWDGGALRVGAEGSRARNDFSFLNTAGVRDTVERRRNADERRGAVIATAVLPGVQLLALASASERGLVGPMNVRVYDRARGSAARGVLRAALARGAWSASASLRALSMRYRDPGVASTRASSVSADVEVERGLGPASVRAGVGADRARGTLLEPTTRPRGWVAADGGAAAGRWRLALGARLDAIGSAGIALSPALAVERDAGAATLFARAGRALRAPTMYDLHFASPQWADATRDLAPERVTLDAEIGVRLTRGAVTLGASAYERRTRDAIVWFPGSFQWSPRNVPLERVRGAETRIAVAAGGVRLEGWAAARRARLRVDGSAVATPYVPGADGGASVGASVGPVTLGASLTAIGRRPIAAVPRGMGRTELPGVALVDLDASWRLPLRRVRATLVAASRNVGDVEWQSVSRHPSPGRSWSAGLSVRP
jgi:outer membrane cobalamin receptor